MIERTLQPLGPAADDPPPQPLPLYADRIVAGFPSPAEDYLQDRLDLNALLIRHPAAAFFVRVALSQSLGIGNLEKTERIRGESPDLIQHLAGWQTPK